MRTHQAWSIWAVGILAVACGASERPSAQHAKSATPPAGTGSEQSAFPNDGEAAAEPPAPEAPSADEAGPSSDASPPPATAAPSPTAGASRAGSGELKAEREEGRAAPKKSARPLDIQPERPGLGTTWGETMSSRVSNAPFERGSSNPFSIATVNYNDQLGISAMLRGASPAAFATSAAAVVNNGTLTVRLVDAGGSPLPTFANGGRNLAQGEVGQRYMIEISNQSPNRVEAVVTVDGLDVIDGRPGSLSKRGYLVQPFATVDIDGFRQNMDEVAAFRFGSVRGSYAAGKGSDRNVGVIGVAFFAERGARQPWNERELNRRESADPFPGRFAAPPLAR
jgi:hypothetical protein